MRPYKLSVLVSLLAFLCGCGVAAVWLSAVRRAPDLAPPNAVRSAPQDGREVRFDIPAAGWVPIFFEATGLASMSIDERARVAGLMNLRRELPAHDVEVRVWLGFGLTPLEGVVLRRAGGVWSATHLAGTHDRLARPGAHERELPPPRSGWDGCWQRLVGAGLLTLPDAAAIGCGTGINDGMSYVVETNADGLYRTYLYDNPDYSECEQAERMLDIGDYLADEFGIEHFKLERQPRG